MLADGSYARVSGQFYARFQGYDEVANGPQARVYQQPFFVLDGLTSDILLCQDLLFDVRAFKEQQHAFIELGDPGHFSDLNLVSWLSKREKEFLRLFKKRAPSFNNGSDGPAGSNSPPGETAESLGAAYHKELDDADAHEQHLRQKADINISRLKEPEKSRRKEAEDRRRLRYDSDRAIRSQAHHALMSAIEQQSTVSA
jgi:hypothetical protein